MNKAYFILGMLILGLVGGVSAISDGDLSFSSVELFSSQGAFVASAGDDVVLSIRAHNRVLGGLDDLRVTILIPELGIKQKTSSFDMSYNKRESADMLINLPENAFPGEYVVKIVLSGEGERSVLYRWITII